MKVKDLILKMSNNTEILVYHSVDDCEMPKWGDCKGGLSPEYDCRDCTAYTPETYEFTNFHGCAGDCPIKIAELTVMEINNAYHDVEAKRKRKPQTGHLIAIRVEE